MPKIKYRDPLGQDASVEISDSFPEVTIGRNPGNVICVNNPSLSRAHARIVYESGTCTFYDLNSSIGSFVNGKEIRSQVLKPGDRLRCGEFPMEYSISTSATNSTGNARSLPPEVAPAPAPTPSPQKPLPPLSSVTGTPAGLRGGTSQPEPAPPLSISPGSAPAPTQEPMVSWRSEQQEDLDNLRREIASRDSSLERARQEHERITRQAEDLQRQLNEAQIRGRAPQEDPLDDIMRSLHQINAQLGEVCSRMERWIKTQK